MKTQCNTRKSLMDNLSPSGGGRAVRFCNPIRRLSALSPARFLASLGMTDSSRVKRSAAASPPLTAPCITSRSVILSEAKNLNIPLGNKKWNKKKELKSPPPKGEIVSQHLIFSK